MPSATTPQTQEIGMHYSHVLIRPATTADDRTLTRLAALDSARVPAGPVLIAEVTGEPHAAMDLETGAVVADPFRRTDHLVELLGVHARTSV
jgi:hypothetical protein